MTDIKWHKFTKHRLKMHWTTDQTVSLSSAVMYGVLSLSMAFLNKAVVSEYQFNFPFFILACQMLLTVCILECLRITGKFSIPLITLSSVKMFALPAFCYSLHATLALVALEGMNIPMYGALKRCTPLVNLILAVKYLKKPRPSTILMTSVFIITLGCVIAGVSDPTFNGYAYTMGALSVVTQAVYLTLVQECGESNLSPLHILHLNSYIAVVPFIILTCAYGEFTAVLLYQHRLEFEFVTIFFLLLVLGLLLNFSLFLCTMLNSALTTSIVGVSKSVLQTVIGFYAFGGITFHLVNIAGIVLNTLGGILYAYAKYKEGQRRHRKIDLGDKGIQQEEFPTELHISNNHNNKYTKAIRRQYEQKPQVDLQTMARETVLAFLFLFSCFIPWSFSRNLEFNPYRDIHSCTEREFFDEVSLECVKCGDNQTSQNEKRHCICDAGFKTVYDGYNVKCEVCPDFYVSTKDKTDCIPCLNESFFDASLRECLPYSNFSVDVSESVIMADRFLNGSVRDNMQFLRCSNDTVVENDSCMPCHPSFYIASGGYCHCPTTHVEFQGICILQKYLEKIPNKESSFMVTFEDGLQVLSSYYQINFRLAAVLCTYLKNRTACQMLSNMCVMHHYEFSENFNACQFYREEYGENFINIPDYVPWLYYTEGEASVYLSKTRLKTQYSFKLSDPNSKLNFTVAKYSVNGHLLGYGQLEDTLTLCPLTDFHLEDAVRFGTTFSQTCIVDVQDIWDSYETVFYDVFLQYYDDDEHMIYAIPVLNRNYKEDGIFVNQQSERKWQLMRRFFLVDNISGKGSLSPKAQDQSHRARVVRYAQNIEILIRLREGESHGLIYPPFFRITYGEVNDDMYSSKQKVKMTLRVSYTMDFAKIHEDLSIAVGVISAFATLWSLIGTWSWSRRCGKLNIDIPTIIHLLVTVCGNLANVFFIVMLFACLYWTIFFKRQDVVHLFLLTDDQEKLIKEYLIAACFLKLIQIVHILYIQVSLDMFIIDWEQPRAKNSLPHPQLSSNLEDQKSNKAEQQPISIWRTYFIANEWNELQTYRKIDLGCQLFITLLFLHVFRFKNLANAGPDSNFNEKDSQYSPFQSYVCRFAISIGIYSLTAACQWLYKAAFYERCIEDKLQQFIDLCSIANISIFILEHKMYGYYIHGRSVHGYADVDMHSFYEQLKREEEDLCGHRGLEPSSECQTFEVAITYKFREQYDNILKPFRGFIGIQKQGSHGKMASSEMEQSFHAHETMKRFFGMFLQHAVRDLDYIVKDKLFLESVLDLEFQEVDDRCLFFRDNNRTFDNVLFCGCEVSFVLFEMLLFTFVDLLSYDFILAAIITFIVGYIIKKVRYAGGRKNVVNKTLVDQRFLI
ncbi:Meckelin [Halocaridina rubra]|uniref:Meckelin n=1 Tax=Halocaridina rubra TaxID=373956 RepID=A0AAN8XN58_HALRR